MTWCSTSAQPWRKYLLGKHCSPKLLRVKTRRRYVCENQPVWDKTRKSLAARTQGPWGGVLETVGTTWRCCLWLSLFSTLIEKIQCLCCFLWPGDHVVLKIYIFLTTTQYQFTYKYNISGLYFNEKVVSI